MGMGRKHDGDVSAELARELLEYDAETGALRWLPRCRQRFKTQRAFATWNARYSGREAFTAINDQGYRVGSIFKKLFRAHRVAYLIVNGEWPAHEVDHRDHDRSNNARENISSASHAQNQKNQSRPKNNTSGIVGVSWCRRKSKWVAMITSDGKQRNLGYFSKKDDAATARKIAEARYAFHANHGA